MDRLPRSDLGVKPLLHRAVPLPGSDAAPLVVISEGSVVYFKGDAVVNAANMGCLGGGGIDGAISSAGGPELLAARRALPELNKRGHRCDVGDAKITKGGKLIAKWCIHAVGPNYHMYRKDLGKSLEDADRLLSSAYVATMARAREAKVATLAVCLLSAGIFKGGRSLDELLSIAVRAVEANVYPDLEEVHIVAFTDEEANVLVRTARKLWESNVSDSPMSSNEQLGEQTLDASVEGEQVPKCTEGCALADEALADDLSICSADPAA